MSVHSIDNFIKPISNGDKFIFIQDINNKLTNEINPWRVTSSYNIPNSCYISIKLHGSDNVMNIKFDTPKNARLALVKFQDAITKLKNQTDNISNEVKDYIDAKILDIVNSSHFAFRQEQASDTWNVSDHGMDKYPSVTIVDDNGEVIEGLYKYLDCDNVQVLFNQEITGWVFLN
jgi:PleD family two-component response regulator